ncbi:putative integral membrane protein [Fusarium flagelliforme]|uniref:Putative integral membrane protein n=1 Tax=Fusarium flagelliforme TaxID=2675880 RepID=A0A395MSM7_9HYPO|nr:putative integral membrane protein [Fusarium flagelliforme]
MGVRDTYYPLVISCLVVDGVAVGLRLWARRLKRAIGYDDIVMCLSFVGFTVFCAMELEAIRYGIGATMMEPDFDPIKAAMIAYILTTGISKLGVGLVLLRLASGADMRTVRIILIISMTIVTLWCLVTTLIFGLQCRPLSVAWGVGEGSCLSTSVLGTTGLALSGMDMTISWFYALLPIYMLYKTQLRLRLKIMIMVLLGLGAVSSIAIIVRLKYLIDLSRLTSASGGLASQEAVETTLEGTIYSILEIGLSILAASLTALRPLLTKLPGFGDSSSKPADFGSLVTFGNRNDNKGPAYRLEDRDVSVVDSQENIVPPRPLTSRSSIVAGPR